MKQDPECQKCEIIDLRQCHQGGVCCCGHVVALTVHEQRDHIRPRHDCPALPFEVGVAGTVRLVRRLAMRVRVMVWGKGTGEDEGIG